MSVRSVMGDGWWVMIMIMACFFLSDQICKHSSSDYDFFPTTYILPRDLAQLKLTMEMAVTNTTRVTRFILKPRAKARGIGIRMLKNFSDLPTSHLEVSTSWWMGHEDGSYGVPHQIFFFCIWSDVIDGVALQSIFHPPNIGLSRSRVHW